MTDLLYYAKVTLEFTDIRSEEALSYKNVIYFVKVTWLICITEKYINKIIILSSFQLII